MDRIIYGEDTYPSFAVLMEQDGVIQHHDAVSGTERQKVENDYRFTVTNALSIERRQFLQSFKRVSGTMFNNLAF